ncbi:hypothetical protein IF2G_07822 [Cordyceps javanica]|nr:hypothetical protein IF2G_07822 [Cordyceps javanica]
MDVGSRRGTGRSRKINRVGLFVGSGEGKDGRGKEEESGEGSPDSKGGGCARINRPNLDLGSFFAIRRMYRCRLEISCRGSLYMGLPVGRSGHLRRHPSPTPEAGGLTGAEIRK